VRSHGRIGDGSDGRGGTHVKRRREVTVRRADGDVVFLSWRLYSSGRSKIEGQIVTGDAFHHEERRVRTYGVPKIRRQKPSGKLDSRPMTAEGGENGFKGEKQRGRNE
jgi:hypothetical protein